MSILVLRSVDDSSDERCNSAGNVAHDKDDDERVDDEVGNDEGDGMSGRRNIRREEEA